MRKIMLIGRTSCGKTTLTQKLMNEEVKYKKTQAVSYKSRIIDTPGEYVENKIYYKSLLVLSADAKIIILDPGLGFGKNAKQNIEILSRLNELRDMGPILLGASKKRFIGKLLNDLPFDERVEGTVATTVIGIEKGVDIVRVHNVLENKRACLVADGIYRKRG